MEGGQASAPLQAFLMLSSRTAVRCARPGSRRRLSTGAFACLWLFLWGNRRRVQRVCQVCLSHLCLSAPYANVQGGLGGTAPWETAGPNPAC